MANPVQVAVPGFTVRVAQPHQHDDGLITRVGRAVKRFFDRFFFNPIRNCCCPPDDHVRTTPAVLVLPQQQPAPIVISQPTHQIRNVFGRFFPPPAVGVRHTPGGGANVTVAAPAQTPGFFARILAPATTPPPAVAVHHTPRGGANVTVAAPAHQGNRLQQLFHRTPQNQASAGVRHTPGSRRANVTAQNTIRHRPGE